MPDIATYARVSTDKQNLQRQIDELNAYLQREYPDAEQTLYADTISGASSSRGEEYDRLWSNIADGKHDVVVVHEISRISRLGAGTIHEFIQHCLEHDTGVESLDVGLSIRLDDGVVDQAVKTLLVGVMGDLARIEHKQKLERINSGIQAAQKAGKWTGRAPRGFEVGDDDKRLHVDVVEFLETRAALERIERGESVNSVADATGIAESSLRYIYDDDARRQMYFSADSDDDRKQAALDELGELPEVAEAEQDQLNSRIREIVRDEIGENND